MQLFLLLLPLALACKRTTLTTTTTQPPPPTTTRTTTTPTTTATTSSTSPTPTTATPRHLYPRPAGNSTTLVTTIPTNATQPTESSNTTTTQAPIDCPDGWIDETAVGLGCLRFVEDPGGLNWLETQTTCQSDIGSSVEALNMDEVGASVPSMWSKGSFQKLLSGFCPLRGYPPPLNGQSPKKI